MARFSMHPNSESRKARQEEMAKEREAARLAEEERLAEEARILAEKTAAEETFNPEDAAPSEEPFQDELKDYASMTVAELKALCAERGLTVSGTKAELITRLTADDESDSTEAPVETAAEEDTATPDESAVAQETQEGEVSESEGEEQ
jgi:hypothetical protein